VERVWGGLKNYVANTAVTWPGRIRQIHSYFRNRSPDQMLDTAAPWTSPWLPPGYEQNFWNAALGTRWAGRRTHPVVIVRKDKGLHLAAFALTDGASGIVTAAKA